MNTYPCKPGSVVYIIEYCTTAEDFGKPYIVDRIVEELRLSHTGNWRVLVGFSIYNDSEFGKSIFTTKKEAENRLRELTGGK